MASRFPRKRLPKRTKRRPSLKDGRHESTPEEKKKLFFPLPLAAPPALLSSFVDFFSEGRKSGQVEEEEEEEEKIKRSDEGPCSPPLPEGAGRFGTARTFFLSLLLCLQSSMEIRGLAQK